MAENLKCSICDQEATVHLTQIVNNKIHKVDLCESCAQKKGVTDPEGFSLADLMSKTPLTPVSGEAQLVCESCGQESADFRRTGRLGCSDCYTVFRSLVFPVLEDMHAGTAHQGKVPTAALSRQSSQMQLKKLLDSLARAVAEEAYEDAAKFRDQIKVIKEAEELEVSSK
ncbi:UvrB/UvrC motif-containing protein [Puniceicoccaceae bacterium]|jgi:protein arginine kinase activator|nr:UvrB/UvrC motif-containing protein [Puniceicoccaceae bacterium]